MEEWRPVLGYEGSYEVSSLGRVRNAAGRVFKCQKGWKGYVQVRLNGKCYWAHRLVAEAFMGPRPAGKVIAHNNGDPSDNRLANLRFSTHAENSADMAAHGTTCAGEHRWNAKLSAKVVEDIRAAASHNATEQALADRYGVSQSQISRVVNGKAWAHVR